MAEKKKQFKNNVVVVGSLKELKVADLVTKTQVPMKIAEAQIEVAEGEVHRVKMMAVEYYERDGEKKENKSYKAIQTMENEYVSKLDIAEGKAEGNATVVYVAGSLELNIYKGQNGLVEQPTINARIISRSKEENPEFKAEFDLQGFLVTTSNRVVKDDEETGEVKFKFATLDYKGMAHPIEFTAEVTEIDGEEVDFASYFEEVEKGQSLYLTGDIVNKYIITKVERQGGNTLGKKQFDTKRESERKLAITGVTEIEEDTPAQITPDEMKKGMELYEAKKVEEQSKENKKDDKPKSIGINKAASKPKSTFNQDNLPF